MPTIKEWGRCFNLIIGNRVFGRDLKADEEFLSERCGWEYVQSSFLPLPSNSFKFQGSS